MDKGYEVNEPIATAPDPVLASELLASLPDPVIGCDAAGRIVYWNPAARDAYGFSDEEAIGARPALLLRTRFPRPALEILEELTDLGVWEGRLVQLTRDGREVAVESRWTARLDPDGNLVGSVLIERPIASTAHLSPVVPDAEDLLDPVTVSLRQTERLESLSQLAGGVAHDFNNALAIIINYTAFVSSEVKRLRGAPTDAQREAIGQDLEEVRGAAERAAELTHQLLAFARQEMGAPQPTSLNACVREIAPLLTRAVGGHITTETRLAPGLHEIDADPAQIQQILVNLAVNARDAMLAGGTLTIETANVELDEQAVAANRRLTAGSYVRLRVSDTGTGMTAEVLERVFDPFFTTKERGHGTGLGLSSVYGIVARHGGQARFFSEPGVGTSFVSVFPAREPGHRPSS